MVPFTYINASLQHIELKLVQSYSFLLVLH
jgi:hypothetical protein